MAVLFMAAFVACDSKKEEKKDDGASKDEAFKKGVQELADFRCEMEKIQDNIKEIQMKYDTAAQNLVYFHKAIELLAGCEKIKPESIEELKTGFITGYLNKRGTGLVLEEKKDKKGVLEAYLIKDEKKKVIETVKNDSIPAEILTEIQSWADMKCNMETMKEEFQKLLDAFNEQFKDDKERDAKVKKYAIEMMGKCEFVSPEELEEMKKEME